MAKQSKITSALLYSLAIISILGFLAIIGNTWFNFTYLDENIPSLILIVLGVGLIVEGQVRRWKALTKNGLTSNEISHIVTGIVGIISLIVGILSLLNLSNPTLDGVKGIIASIGVVIIVIETWVVK